MKQRNSSKDFFEGNVSLPALTAGLDRICREVGNDGLTETLLQDLRDDIRMVSEHFGISQRGAILLAFIVENSSGNGCDEDQMAGFVGCSNIAFTGFRDDLAEMERSGVILRGNLRGRRTVFLVSREAAKSIETGSPFTPTQWEGLTSDELFTRLRLFFSDYQQDVINAEHLLTSIRSLIECNPTLTFCREVMGSRLWTEGPATEQRFFFYLCHRLVSYGNTQVAIDRLLNLTDYLEDDKRLCRNLFNEATFIQKEGLVTFGGKDQLQDMDSLSLSDDVVKTFLSDIRLVRRGEGSERGLTRATDIRPKELYYNDDTKAQMETLLGLLEKDNFQQVRNRLSEMGMRKGFAVLFSGGAGCGKTAGVYELARRTGRDVYAVDMSELRSKWVGESEKIVKGVFSTYVRMCRDREIAPILLFNEADAIFSKRIENPEDSVDQMMNTIQNICLDAIENLDGILIATTNLPGNFCDEAFERRFLFKVNFSTPDATTRGRIWKAMIPTLPEADAAALGQRYSFSGGNIENIARKAAVGYVLSGRQTDLDTLLRYCQEETTGISGKRTKIGF